MKKGFATGCKPNRQTSVCIQETRPSRGDVDQKLLAGMGYQDYWNSAEKKGTAELRFLPK
jgi:exonuclease III